MYEDKNAAVPVDFCPRCGGEIYDNEEFCVECRENTRRKRRRYDQNTVEDMMEEVDYFLKRYLSENLCNELWNLLSERFRAEEE